MVTTGLLSVYLPRCVLGYQTRTEQLSMATAIGLSLGLFSLSLLEAVPSAWLMILSHEPSSETHRNLAGTIFTISRMYWWLFWALSVVILLIYPCLGGASMATLFRGACSNKHMDHDKGKYSAWKQAWRSSPWWIRLLVGLVRIVGSNLWRFFRRLCFRSRVPVPELTISRSMSEDEVDLEFRGLVTPTNPATISNRSDHVCMAFGGLVGVTTAIVMVSTIGPLVVHTTPGMTWLSVVVSWLCAIGLLISSLLNGFGSVSMPYTCLAGLFLTTVRPELITKLEAELQSVRDARSKKRVALRELTVTVKHGAINGATQTVTFANKSRGFSNIGEELGNRRLILQTEIDFLEILCKDMQEDIEELRYSQHAAAAARTTMGKARSYVGLVFSVMLLVRLGSAAMSIWQNYTIDTTRRKAAHGDVVTTALLWLSGHHLVSPKDFTMHSQVVSLVLTAVLTFTQARTFFRAMATVHRRLGRFYYKCNCGPSRGSVVGNDEWTGSGVGAGTLAPGIFSQILAGATGCYFLSCIVLIKMMLPDEFCLDFANAMGGMDVFTIHSSVVNTVFACSACISLFILAMLFGIQKQNNLRHTLASKEITVLRGGDAV